MAVGPDGLLYVIDPASVVTVIDPATGRVVRRFGRQGSGDGEFACHCHAIHAGPDGRLYVVDDGNQRVQVLEPDGTFVRQLGAFGSAEGQFVFPFALTIDEAGAVYVLDGDNGMISKFGADGAFVWRVGGLSGDAALRGGAYDLAAMKDGTILVTFDPGGPAVLLDPDDGSVIGPWGEESLGAAAEPTVDPAGNVFLFQYVPGAMRMFDAGWTSARDPGLRGRRAGPVSVLPDACLHPGRLRLQLRRHAGTTEAGNRAAVASAGG